MRVSEAECRRAIEAHGELERWALDLAEARRLHGKAVAAIRGLVSLRDRAADHIDALVADIARACEQSDAARAGKAERARDDWKARFEALDVQGYVVARERDAARADVERLRAALTQAKTVLGLLEEIIAGNGLDADDRWAGTLRDVADAFDHARTALAGEVKP